jgi:glycosyltransferase involved in cell wall biosynthesis
MLDWTTRWSCRAARHVIAISETTKSDLIDCYGVPSERITVIPHGVTPMVATAEEMSRVRQHFELPKHFILAVGTIQPRKNLARLAGAIANLAANGFPHYLVVAGKRGWSADEVEREIAINDPTRRTSLLGYVAERDLAALYATADVVCFPSLYEGFGLPALEAMAAGCPVVVSDRGALPEVTGGAAEVVDPLDVGSITAGLTRVLTNDAHRGALINRGRARAVRFSWERTARATLDVLRTVRDA